MDINIKLRRLTRGSAAALGVLMLVSCGVRNEAPKEKTPIPVRVVTVTPSQNAGSKSYVGTAVPEKSAVISTNYPGTLVSLSVSEGDRVKKGDVIAQVESQTVKSTWEMAHATLRQAEDGYERLTQVHGSGSVADVKMVEIETQLAKARASAEAADRALADCTVKAPFDGVIGEVFVEQGVELSPVDPLVRLLDISKVNIEISVPESEYSAISQGDRAGVNVPALGDGIFQARLDRKGLVASPLSHSYKFTLVPSLRVEGLMPGMVCKVVFGGSSEGIVIPASVVRTDESGRYVWTVEASGETVGASTEGASDGMAGNSGETATDLPERGKVVKKYLTLGGFSGDGVVVTSGLSAGDLLITEGMQKVSSGMTVKIAD